MLCMTKEKPVVATDVRRLTSGGGVANRDRRLIPYPPIVSTDLHPVNRLSDRVGLTGEIS